MLGSKDLIIDIHKYSDIDKIVPNTKYINIDITNYDKNVIEYFKLYGANYLYTETIDNISGYVYVSYDEFIKAEAIVDMLSNNIPTKLSKLEIARYLYISLGKLVSFDINLSLEKTDSYNLNLINTSNNIWGGLSIGKVNDLSASKIYYYLCKKFNINISVQIKEKNIYTKIIIDKEILYTDIFKDIPYIQSRMKTKSFSTYNDNLTIDRKIKYIKNNYTDNILDRRIKKIDNSNDLLREILIITEDLIDIKSIKPIELSIIYKYIFNTYYPNYDIKINNFYLNNKYKNHFIVFTYKDYHYSYNYRWNKFAKINENDIINNLKLEKICLYQNELVHNINY